MNLSAPIYSLKRAAKSLSRQKRIPLHAALDKVAQDEGFRNWSLLASRAASGNAAISLLQLLAPGKLVLLSARPGQGKTLTGVDLVAKFTKRSKHGWFFTLEWSQADVDRCLNLLGECSLHENKFFHFDGSDSISAKYIIEQLADAEKGTVVVIDYLQLLDQKRSNPSLSEQVNNLKYFAQLRGIIIVCLSQVDRSFESTGKRAPALSDVRIPNPIDLRLFDQACFLHNGKFAHKQLA